MYSFEQLRGFVAVAEELHFGRAAARLSMTQPPLSRQIQRLERAIGVQLFERDNRRVELTHAGTAFLAEARRLLALAEAAPDLARRISSGSVGVARIGFTAASAYAVLPTLLARLRDRLPEVELDLSELVTHHQLEALASQELDVGLARPPFNTELFASRLLVREPMRVAVPEDHWLAQLDRPVRADDLTGEALVLPSADDARYFYDLVVTLVRVDATRVVQSVSQVLTITLLVAGGLGVALVPDSVSRLGIPGVRLLELEGAEAAPAELHLLWAKDARNPALPRLLDALQDWSPSGG